MTQQDAVADELRLIADNIARLGKSGELTPPRCEETAQRIRRLAATVASFSGKTLAKPGPYGALIQFSPFVGMADHQGQSLTASPREGSLAPVVPKTPAQPHRPSHVVATANAHRNSASKQFALTKPMSTAAALRRLSSVNSGGRPLSSDEVEKPTAQKELKHVMGATLFNALEAVALAMHVESAHIYVPLNDEMVSIVNVGPKLQFPPALVHHVGVASLSGGVLSSGVAVSQRHEGQDDNRAHVKNMLLFPMYNDHPAYMQGSPTLADAQSTAVGRPVNFSTISAAPESSRQVLGVIQVSNKYRGAVGFSTFDETFLSCAAIWLGRILQRYPKHLNWHDTYYDPATVHEFGRYEADVYHDPLPILTPTTLGQVMGIETQSKRPSRVEPGNAVKTLSSFSDYTPTRLIYRTSAAVSLAKRQALADDAVGLGVAPCLVEVDSFVSNLQECWRRSVDLNVHHSHAEAERARQNKQLRDELAASKAECTKLREQLRLQTLDSGDFRREYASLKEELESVLRNREL